MEREIEAVLTDPTRVLFLDVETSAPWHGAHIAIIGWSMDGRYEYRARGWKMRRLAFDASHAACLVTFNGKAFDVPRIRDEHPELQIPELHLDLVWLCKSIGLAGGLKAIEREVGIVRPDDIAELGSKDAPELWKEWVNTGERKHLRRLVKYNRADVMNLIPLLACALERKGHDARGVRGLMEGWS